MNTRVELGFDRAQRKDCLRLLKKTIFEGPEIGPFILGLGNVIVAALGWVN
jgi:hypothetical protein